MRFLLNEKNRQNNDLQAEIAGIRDQISRREAEIFSNQREVQQKSDQGFGLRKDLDSCNFELQKLKEERSRDQEEIDRLRDLNSFKERENTEADQRIKGLDYDLFKSQERANDLSKQSEALEFDLRRTTEAYECAHADLLRARDEQARLQAEQSNLQRTMELRVQEKGELSRKSEGEQNRNRDQSQHLYDLEAKARNAEEQLAASRKEQEDLRFSNHSMQGHNDDLRAEIDALQRHCNVLQGQNRDLNCELESFVQTDEQIRATLNRRDRVNDLRVKTETEIRASYADLERSSPKRRH